MKARIVINIPINRDDVMCTSFCQFLSYDYCHLFDKPMRQDDNLDAYRCEECLALEEVEE